MNFFKFYIGDYQRDTAHLSVAEHGAYMLMLQHYYATERPLPTGKALHRMLRAQDKVERDAIDAVVDQFWTEIGDGLVNERADAEMMKANAQAETNHRIAVAREEARKFKRLQHERSTNRAEPSEPEEAKNTRKVSEKLAKSASSLEAVNPLGTTQALDLIGGDHHESCTNRATNDEPNHSHSHKEKKDLAPSELVGNAVSDAWKCPPCPHEEIVRLYGEHLPQLPRCIALNDQRRSHIGARWRQVCVDAKFSRVDGLEWFAGFFRDVSRSRFLTGNGGPGKDGRIWRADLDWLMNPTNFLKVFEGRYHPERAAA